MKAALCVIQRVGEVSTMLPPRELGVRATNFHVCHAFASRNKKQLCHLRPMNHHMLFHHCSHVTVDWILPKNNHPQ